jgi:hypothetical protein
MPQPGPLPEARSKGSGGWFADIRTGFLRDLSDCYDFYTNAGTKLRESCVTRHIGVTASVDAPARTN